jgi:hypothetical protein
MLRTNSLATAPRTSGDPMTRDGLKATPGPWTLEERECGGYRLEDIDGSHIAYLERTQFVDERDDPEQEANCKLIASAPELYDALDTAAKRFRQYEQLHLAKYTEEGDLKAANNADLAEVCERALAKARGEQP